MKLSNWCILFAGLFLCMILGLDLKIRYQKEAQCRMEIYNRNLDRAAEDALWGAVVEEYEDGSVLLDAERVQKQFLKQLELDFECRLDREGETVESGEKIGTIKLARVINEKEPMSREETEAVIAAMEAAAGEGENVSYGIYMAGSAEEDWKQEFMNNSFYVFLEMEDGSNYPWLSGAFTEGNGTTARYVFGGGHVVKQ